MKLRLIFFLLIVQVALWADEEATIKHIYRKALDLSTTNIIGYNIGVRPYRKSGIRLETEYLQDKIIIHNYGYGGSGLSLCWGGAHEVASLLDKETPNLAPPKAIAILGAGVIGLASAYDLLQKGYQVHIYAGNWMPNLTSNVGAGIWTPPPVSESTSPERMVFLKSIVDNSKARWSESLSEKPEFAGVRIIEALFSYQATSSASSVPKKTSPLEPDKAIEEVIVHFDNGVQKIVQRTFEFGIDGKLFLEDLLQKVEAKGALFFQKHFSTPDDLLELQEPIIINCTSLGSRELFNDKDFVPVRGELIYFLPQNGIDYLLYQSVPNDSNYWVSIYPWSDRLVVGGVNEKEKEELEIDPKVIEALLDHAQKCVSGDL